MDLITEKLRLQDVFPNRAEQLGKEYGFNAEKTQFVRKGIQLDASDIEIDEGERAAIRYITTANLDRDNEIIIPDGMILTDFKKSPTVLYAHDYRGLPIGRDQWIKLEKGRGIKAKTEYANHQFANDVYELVKGGFLNTSSVGFIPLESVEPEDDKWGEVTDTLEKDWGIGKKEWSKAKRIYTKSLLLEHSDVPVASNINALNIAVGKGLIQSEKIKFDLGIITKPEETENFIRIPIRDCKVTATIDISKKDGIKALYCGKIKKVRTYLFDKRDPYNWTMAKAKKWVEAHGKGIDKACEVWDKRGDLELTEQNISELLEEMFSLLNEKTVDKEPPEYKEEKKQTYSCECIKCGWKHTSKKHCNTYKCEKCGGTMRQAERPGPGQRVLDIESASKKEILLTVEKLIEDYPEIKDILKEGRVLSAKNRKLVKQCADMLNELYDATEPPEKEIEFELEKDKEVDIEIIKDNEDIIDIEEIDEMEEWINKVIKDIAKKKKDITPFELAEAKRKGKIIEG